MNENQEKKKKPFYKRWWFVVIIIILVINAIGGGEDETDRPEERDEEIDQPTVELSLEDNIIEKVKNITNEKTNRKDVDKIIYIGLDENNVATIQLNANDNLSQKMIKNGILMDNKDIFESLSELEELTEVIINNYFPLVDKYGESKDANILNIKLTRETMDKIKWDNFIYKNLESVADTYYQHPSFN